MNFYFIGIAILILGAIFSLFIKNPTSKLKAVSIFSILGAINVIVASIKTFITGASDVVFSLGSVFQNVRFSLDNISAFFAIIIAIMSTLAIIYSNGYLKLKMRSITLPSSARSFVTAPAPTDYIL